MHMKIKFLKLVYKGNFKESYRGQNTLCTEKTMKTMTTDFSLES